MGKPTVRRGTQTTTGYKNTGTLDRPFWQPQTKKRRVDMFQRDLDIIEKVKHGNLTTGDQEYLAAALHKLATYERDQYSWED